MQKFVILNGRKYDFKKEKWVKDIEIVPTAEYIDIPELIKNVICSGLSIAGIAAIVYFALNPDKCENIGWMNSPIWEKLLIPVAIIAACIIIFVICGIIREEIRYRKEVD